MSARSSLISNSLAQAGLRAIGSACALLLTWLIARQSVESLGIFRTLFAYFLICEFIPLLGMQTYLFREIALHRSQVAKYGFHAIVFALAASLLGVAALIALALMGGYSPNIRDGLFLVAASLPATAASLVGLSILVGVGQTTRFSLIQGIETLARTLFGIIAIWLGWGVFSVIAALVVARWVVLVGYWRAVQPLLSTGPARFDQAFFREFLRHLPVFAGITVLALVLRFAAPTMLPWMLDDAAAGQFAAAYVFIDLVLLVPTALTTNLVPILAHQALVGPSELVDSCRQSIKIMALGVLPIAAVTAVIARPMFAALFPGNESYAVSAAVLEVIIWTGALLAIDQVLSAAMVARGKQNLDLQALLTGAAGTAVLLALLIPLHGVIGAAFGVLGGIILLVATRFILVRRQIGVIRPFALLWRPGTASAAAGAAAFATSSFHWLIGAATGALAYIAMAVLLGAFTRSERDDLVRLLQAGKL